ncbi:MAG: TIGR03936 family radical SAM-associated protein [Oscillospiraceae bacterium]
MSKKRVQFSKTGMGKYISHLDLLRTFTRAIMRAELPVLYSQGFNPHQKITFSLPLPIGVTSECECVDIDFDDTVQNAEIMKKLNENLPMDMKVLGISDPVYKANDIVSAQYLIEILSEKPLTDEIIRNFFGASEIVITKKSKKKGEVSLNLLDFVKAWEVTKRDENSEKNIIVLKIVLTAGNTQNVKPELLVKALEDFAGLEEFENFNMHRIKIFCKTNEESEKVEIFC